MSETQFTEEDRKVMEFGIAHNLGYRYKEASEHLLADYDHMNGRIVDLEAQLAAERNRREKVEEQLAAQGRLVQHWQARSDSEQERREKAEALTLELAQRFAELRRYHAVEGRLGSDDKLMVGLAYDGSIWGPVYDPKYDGHYEMAEAIAEWLHEKCDEVLARPDVRALL